MYLNKNTTPFTKIKAQPITIGDIQYPKSIFTKYSDVELNTIGLYKISYSGLPNRRYYTATEVENFDGNTPSVSYASTPKNLNDIKAVMINDVISKAKTLLDEAVSKYSSAEMASWDGLESQARAYIGGELITNCPMLKDEADLCSQDYTLLANEVIANAEGLKAYRTFVVAKRYNKIQAINALLDVSACEVYENEPYNYTITADDVANDIDGSLVEGQIVVRYRNNVTDWS